MADPVSIYVDVDGIANLTIKNPPVNALAPHVLMGLHDRFLEANSRQDVRAIVISGDNGKFSGGFDITAIVRQQKAGVLDRNLKDVSVKLMAEIIEGGAKPTVAAIEGLALGGGLELALSCNARVAVSKSQLGLPELQLGIIPGFGGTQRLPRLVGVQKAVEMMLTSKPVSAEQGLELGLVDKVVANRAELLPAARAIALDIVNRRAPRMNTLTRTDRLDSLGDSRAIVTFAAAQAKQAAPNLEHPQECLAAVMWGIEHGGYAGLLKEAEIFQRLALSDASKGLAHVFLAQRGTGKVSGVTDKGLTPRPMKTVAVVGGGLMGSGICTALALSGYQVLLKEVNQQFLDAGLGRIEANLNSRVKKGKMTAEKKAAVMGRVKGVLDYGAFGSADMVIEAAIEDIPLKQALFRDLEAACSPNCILATNTSTIDIELVGKLTKAQPRIIGAHFFSPAHVMPLLEIVRTKQSCPQVLLDTIALGKAIKKVPVVVGNCTGFAVNRVFFPYTSTASLLADLGMDPYVIDKAIKAFGMPMGPFRLCDLVGMEVTMKVGKQFATNFPERVYTSTLIPSLVQDQRFGERTKKGIYAYDDKRKAVPDKTLAPYLDKSRAQAALPPVKLTPTAKDIVEMIFFPVVNEGCRVVAEKVVDKPADLDIATVLAMGFPPYRGGIIKWADLVGPAYILKRLREWEKVFGPKLGGLFTPCDYLVRCVQAGVPLGEGVDAVPSSKL